MNSEKLLELVRNIRDLKYPISALRDVDAFEGKVAADLGMDRREAMALLGYLLASDYVRLIPDMGLVINPANFEIQRLIESGKLNKGIRL